MNHTMNSQKLFRRSRLRLAAWYALAMGGILSVSGLGMAQAFVRANWVALEREIESTAGTLHDSLESIVPTSQDPVAGLRQIVPDLCIINQACVSTVQMPRHTLGIRDRTTYYVRLFDTQGNLRAYSPNQPEPPPAQLNPATWQTLQTSNGDRYRQFITILHSAEHSHTEDEIPHDHPSWGHLQVGRTLATFDADLQRLRWTLAVGFPLALGLIAVSSWWLSGLAMQPIYQSYQQQQQFTANAAHELRSPLASLLATVEAILRLPPEQEAQVPILLQTVERQGRRLSQLISDLLLLNRLEQDAMSEPSQPCCLNDIVSDLTEELGELAAAAEMNLSCEVPETEVYVMGYEPQLYRLFNNLMANAIQYTLPGGSVSVNLMTHERFATITVKDTGIGIPVEEQTRIFERFYRVNSDRSRKTGGTGLGLAIAKAIAQRHESQIRIDSKLQQGSCFSVQFKALDSLLKANKILTESAQNKSQK